MAGRANTQGTPPQFAFYAMAAGVCGASSAFVSKLTVTDQRDFWWGLRILFFAGNAFFTAQMWRYYLKALSLGPTGLCSVVSSGTNFVVSALLGISVFGEAVSLVWCVGAALCWAGLALAVTERSESAPAAAAVADRGKAPLTSTKRKAAA